MSVDCFILLWIFGCEIGNKVHIVSPHRQGTKSKKCNPKTNLRKGFIKTDIMIPLYNLHSHRSHNSCSNGFEGDRPPSQASVLESSVYNGQNQSYLVQFWSGLLVIILIGVFPLPVTYYVPRNEDARRLATCIPVHWWGSQQMRLRPVIIYGPILTHIEAEYSFNP